MPTERSNHDATDEQIHLGCTFGELTLQGLLRFPERVGIVAGERQFTYRQIVEAISRVIQVLKAHGLQRGQGIAQLSSNAPEILFVWFAAAIMSLRHTPLHPLGSEDDQAFILEDAEIAALVVDAAAFADRGRALEARIKTLTSVFTVGPADDGIDLSAEMAKCRPGPVRVEAQPEDICTLNYTGGTTGRPKGVILPNRVHVAARLAMLTAMAGRGQGGRRRMRPSRAHACLIAVPGMHWVWINADRLLRGEL
ncbi:MAG: AMP-binding protein [Candidatus Lambdaproteobacteria bacterium]|nr:AMP-binding protein [Candidatus Lambdaproteobacteria bacterium]